MEIRDGGYKVIDRADIGYLEKLLLRDGRLVVVQSDVLRDVPQDHISQFCVEHGFYCIPTVELIDYLESIIDGWQDQTIEIGAGCGVIGEALGIKSTDNYMQDMPKYRKIYAGIQQATVPYGPNVLKLDALQAVHDLKPKIVIAAWVTHKYNPDDHWREGNELGIDEAKLLRRVSMYIHIGNVEIHKYKPILKLEHKTVKAPWLFSRSQFVNENVIWIWKNPNKRL